MSVVSSDDAPEPLPSPLPLSSRFLTHWPATCSLFLLPITRSSVFCASCYMSMSLVIKNALWLSHVLVYWIKENPNIIVINTNNITIWTWMNFVSTTHHSQLTEAAQISRVSLFSLQVDTQNLNWTRGTHDIWGLTADETCSTFITGNDGLLQMSHQSVLAFRCCQSCCIMKSTVVYYYYCYEIWQEVLLWVTQNNSTFKNSSKMGLLCCAVRISSIPAAKLLT